jgi:hypothetical protein
VNILSNLVSSYKAQVLAKIAPDVAKLKTLEAEFAANVGPLLASVTPAEEQAALQLLFPNQSATSIASFVTGLSLLQNLLKEGQAVVTKASS